MATRILSLAALWLLWFGFSSSVSGGEIVGASVCTLAVLAAQIAVRKSAPVPSGTRLRWIGQAALAWPRRILSDTARVASAPFRARVPETVFRRVPMPHQTPIEIAWSVLGTSITPNAYIVGWDDDARELLVNELVPSGQPDEELVWRPR